MPAAVRCLLDQGTQGILLEILSALQEESETGTIELDGETIDLSELHKIIKSCDNKERRGTRRRGPKEPSKYNIFIGSCRKEGTDFSTCVKRWNEQKKVA